jgi:hypothetical protein
MPGPGQHDWRNTGRRSTFSYQRRTLAAIDTMEGPLMRRLTMLGMMLASAASLSAQTNVPPERGGLVASLGLPAVYEGSGAVMAGMYRPGDSSAAAVNAVLGVRRFLGSPVVGIAALGLEGYGGVRGREVVPWKVRDGAPVESAPWVHSDP